MEHLESLRVKDLNDICKTYGIRTGGRKKDIATRILANTAYQLSRQRITNDASDQCGDNGRKGTKRSASTEISASGSAKKQKNHREQRVNAINEVFDRFQDEESPDCITDDGILDFCKELGIDSQDPVILALSWYMEAEAMCVFTRQEFVRGFEKLECCSMDDLKAELPILRGKLRNREDFLHIYLFSYAFAKESTQKSLALDMAIGLWEILLPGYFPLLHHWLEFVRTHCRNSISKDLWMQVMDFGHQIKSDLSNFDENGAWPVLIDDFAAHMKEMIKTQGLDAVIKQDDGESAMIVDS